MPAAIDACWPPTTSSIRIRSGRVGSDGEHPGSIHGSRTVSPLPGRAAFTEVAWVVAGQAAAVVGSLALLRLLTTIMTPDEYGRLALGLTLAGLVGHARAGAFADGQIVMFWHTGGQVGIFA